jgi:hypothetical protein
MMASVVVMHSGFLAGMVHVVCGHLSNDDAWLYQVPCADWLTIVL